MCSGYRIANAVLFRFFRMFCCPLPIMFFTFSLIDSVLFFRSHPFKISIMIYLYLTFMGLLFFFSF